MELSTILSIILTATVSSLSLIVSILTIFLNNKHNKQMKILDIVYEKKYEHYQKFFELYANFSMTMEYDKTILSNIIVNCLLIANEKTSRELDIFLRMLKREKEIVLEGKHDIKSHIDRCFRNCIVPMKEELHLS